MSLKSLVFVTGNRNKVLEAEKILGVELEVCDLDLQEVQEIDVYKVVEEKARLAFEEVGKPVMVEDTGLFCEGMNGFPGALIKWVLKSVGCCGLVKMVFGFEDCLCFARTGVGVFDGVDFHFFEGEVFGTVVKPRGDNGFGWDFIFQPDGFFKTFAEMSLEEKNEFSMRKVAFEKLKEELF